MLEFGNLQMPYLDSSDAPDIGGQALAQAQRLELVSGAGVAMVDNLGGRDALVTNGDAFDGLLVMQKDTHEFWMRTASAWVPLSTNHWAMKRVAAQSHTTSGAWQTLDPDTAVIATLGFAEVAGTITCSVAGTYRVRYRVEFAANVTGTRGIRLRKNAVSVQEHSQGAATASIAVGLTDEGIITLAAADTIDVQALQSSGAALNLTAGHIFIDRVV